MPVFDADQLDRFACPACLGRLFLVDDNSENLLCQSCGRLYPLQDGIPVLIAERAENAADQ